MMIYGQLCAVINADDLDKFVLNSVDNYIRQTCKD
jgi:hypothetical protein